MATPKLNGSRRAASSPAEEELENSYEAPELPKVEEAAPTELAAVAEPDEFDIAAEVVGTSNHSGSSSESSAPADATSSGSAGAQSSVDTPEEEQAKTADELAMEEYRRQTGASQEEAQAWLAAAKSAAPSQQAQPAGHDHDHDRDHDQRHPTPPSAAAGLGALLGGIGGGLGSGIRGIKRGVADATNAALRGTGVRPAAGLTPDAIKNRLFNNWHHDYEVGVNGMERSMADLVKTATAYNQLVKTSAPGRELEKIAKSRGTDIKTLMSQVTDGSLEDADAKAAVAALQNNQHVKNAWAKFEKSVDGYGESLGQVQHNMTQLVNNKSGKIDLEIESARLNEIHDKRSKVEQPFELPANSIDEAKPDGKSKQKSTWEQFLEMSQNGLNFLQSLFDKVATFVASKFGR